MSVNNRAEGRECGEVNKGNRGDGRALQEEIASYDGSSGSCRIVECKGVDGLEVSCKTVHENTNTWKR